MNLAYLPAYVLCNYQENTRTYILIKFIITIKFKDIKIHLLNMLVYI